VKITEELFTANSLQTIYKHNENTVSTHLEEQMEEEQCGFRKGQSYVDAIFTAQQITEKRMEHNLPLFLLFIDYNKVHDDM
jgi:hypothetical protein